MIKILIGPRSVGKTTVGLELAKHLNEDYYDFDEYVDRELKSIDSHIERYGVQSYRENETKLLPSFLSILSKSCVLSLGGGTIASQFQEYNKRNEDVLSGVGIIIYLSPGDEVDSALEILHQRESSRGGDKSFDETKKLFPLRKPQYEKLADLTVFVKEFSPEEIVEHIVAGLNN